MGASPATQRRQGVERSRRVLDVGTSGEIFDAFELFLPGQAHGQGRARAGNGRVYTPAATRAHAERVQGEWIAADRPTLPADCWYVLYVNSWRARPASHYLSDGTSLSATGRRSRYPGKPDCDNELKAIADALVACGAIPDDRLCVAMRADKHWCTPNVREGVFVRVEVA